MSVKGAVEKAGQARAEVERAERRPSTPAELLAATIDKQAEAFRAVLPATTDPDRFSRLVLNACKTTPKLLECFGTQQGGVSLLMSAMQAATMGLEPNTPAQEAWLLPRNVKSQSGQWHVEAELSIGYRGYLKLMRNTGGVRTAFAEVVYEHDEFVWSRGLDRDEFEHRPLMDGNRGELAYAYAVVRYERGGYDFVVLTRAEVEARRGKSDSWKNERSRPYSPWTTAPAAMWRKSAMRELAKWVELSPEARSAIASDEAQLRFDPDAGVIETVMVTDGDRRALAAPAGPEPVDGPEGDIPGEDLPADVTPPALPDDPEFDIDGDGQGPDPIEATATESKAPAAGTPKGAYFARHTEAARLAETGVAQLRKQLVLILTNGESDSASGWPDDDERWVGLNRLLDRMLERREVPYPKASGGWELRRLPGGQDTESAPPAGDESDWLDLDGDDWKASVRQAGQKAADVLRRARELADELGLDADDVPATLGDIAGAPDALRLRLGAWLGEQG